MGWSLLRGKVGVNGLLLAEAKAPSVIWWKGPVQLTFNIFVSKNVVTASRHY